MAVDVCLLEGVLPEPDVLRKQFQMGLTKLNEKNWQSEFSTHFWWQSSTEEEAPAMWALLLRAIRSRWRVRQVRPLEWARDGGSADLPAVWRKSLKMSLHPLLLLRRL